MRTFAFTCAAMIIGAPALAGGVLAIPFGDTGFVGDPLVIDNEYWPLNPDGGTGRTFTYEAEDEDGCVSEEATIVGGKTLLGGAAPYAGFMVLEVEDIGYVDEECTGDWVKEEHTLDWYRQDEFGNIWYLGELSRIYEDEGECSGSENPSEADRDLHPECYEGSWESGKASSEGGLVAEAGIVVPSNYPLGDEEPPLEPGTYYMQELADEAMDVAKVLKISTKVKFKDDSGTTVFHDCRVTKEYTAVSPGSIEQKNYCPDDGGLVLIEELAGGASVLVVLTDISPPLP